MVSVQDDFVALTVPGQESLELFHDHAHIFPCGSSSVKTICEKTSIEAGYTPVNYIGPEVMALIAHWEASTPNKMSSAKDGMKMTFNMQESIYDPIKPCDSPSVPPKRFYRTFWRSLTRRYVQSSIRENSV